MLMRLFSTFCIALLPAIAWGQAPFRATYYVDGSVEKEQNRSHTSLESVEQGASVVYATNEVELILTKMRLNKTSGSINDADRRDTGRNSVIMADGGSMVYVEYCEVNSHTERADGITASGTGTKVDVLEGKLTMSRGGSVAANATKGAYINLQHPQVNTYSNQSSAFYTSDEGSLNVIEAVGATAGQASALFYSSGHLVAEKCRMQAAKWTIGTVDGGTMHLEKNVVQSGGICGFLLYGNRTNNGHGQLELAKNEITVGEGPLFLVTNTTADITVTGNKISSKSKELMSVRADDWGVKGANGGKATLNVEKQSLSGSITVDSISSMQLNLRKGGKVNGQINDKENRCAVARVRLEAGSSWTSKGESHLTSIEFSQPVANGVKQLKGKHTIYYDPSDPANAPLQGKEYKTGGGKLVPLK